MFAYSSVRFTQDDYKKCIIEGVFKSPIDPSVLNKVTNADQMYLFTGINVHFKELYNFGSPSGCSYSQFFVHILQEWLQTVLNTVYQK